MKHLKENILSTEEYKRWVLNNKADVVNLEIDSFIINFDKKMLYLNFNGVEYVINLKDGDLEDNWNSFVDSGGVTYDVNFTLNDDLEPVVSVYSLVKRDGVGFDVDYENFKPMKFLSSLGSIKNYI